MTVDVKTLLDEQSSLDAQLRSASLTKTERAAKTMKYKKIARQIATANGDAAPTTIDVPTPGNDADVAVKVEAAREVKEIVKAAPKEIVKETPPPSDKTYPPDDVMDLSDIEVQIYQNGSKIGNLRTEAHKDYKPLLARYRLLIVDWARLKGRKSELDATEITPPPVGRSYVSKQLKTFLEEDDERLCEVFANDVPPCMKEEVTSVEKVKQWASFPSPPPKPFILPEGETPIVVDMTPRPRALDHSISTVTTGACGFPVPSYVRSAVDRSAPTDGANVVDSAITPKAEKIEPPLLDTPPLTVVPPNSATNKTDDARKMIDMVKVLHGQFEKAFAALALRDDDALLVAMADIVRTTPLHTAEVRRRLNDLVTAVTGGDGEGEGGDEGKEGERVGEMKKMLGM